MSALGRWGALLAGAAMVVVPVGAWAAAGILTTPHGALSFDRLAPGISRTSVVTVHNPSGGSADIALQVNITSEDENGCLRQESTVEGSTCNDSGELGDWLDVTITRDGADVWSGSMRDLQDRQLLPGVLEADDSWDLDFAISLPFEAGNDTMTDRIVFDLTAYATADTGQDPAVLGDEGVEVLGVQGTGGGGPSGSSGEFPITAVNAGLGALGLDQVVRTDPLHLFLVSLFGLVVVTASGLVIGERRRNRHLHRHL